MSLQQYFAPEICGTAGIEPEAPGWKLEVIKSEALNGVRELNSACNSVDRNILRISRSLRAVVRTGDGIPRGLKFLTFFKVSWLGFTAKELTKAWAKLGNLDAVGSSCPGVVRLKGSPLSLELLPTEMGLCSNTI